MQIKCDYCGSMFDEKLERCPNCGASNDDVMRSVSDQPKTIEGLKNWYSARRLPPYETTRFFIGMDYKQPRAFGIYKDENSGKIVVYKNKDDGSRAIRYEGTDEAYAVNELYMRLKSEILEQKERNIQLSKQIFSEAEKEEAYDYFTQKPASKEDKEEAFDYIKQRAEHKAAEDEAYQDFFAESEYKRKRKETLMAVAIPFGVMVILLIYVFSFLIRSNYHRNDSNTWTYTPYVDENENVGSSGSGNYSSSGGYSNGGNSWDYDDDDYSYSGGYSNDNSYHYTTDNNSWSSSSDDSWWSSSSDDSWWSSSDDSGWSSSDDSWDWGGSDSWDSDYSDWGSDW